MDHKPDFTNSEPAVNIGPFPHWRKIVSLDPLGHLSPWLFSDIMRNENIHIKPSIAITKAVGICTARFSVFDRAPDLETGSRVLNLDMCSEVPCSPVLEEAILT